MASMAATKPSICPEKVRLTGAYVQAARAVVQLHEQEIDGLLQDKRLDRLDVALKQAQERRDEAKTALLLHQSNHHC